MRSKLVAAGALLACGVIAWAQGVLSVHGRARIAVTGPRATRWKEGEVVARRLVTALASARGQ